MAQFGAKTEGTEVVAAFPESVKDRTFLITGPSPGGIGSAAAYALAQGSPAILILLARSQSKYHPIINKIHEINSSVTVKFFETDLSSFASVRQTATAILADKDITTIDVLINNAGVIVNDLIRTPDGCEPQFAINHLSHFLLTNLLMPRLLAAPAPRVVNISSLGHKYREPTFADPHFREGDPAHYNPAVAYAQSKGAQILFSVALNTRLASRGLKSYAVQPGDLNSGMYDHMNADVLMDMAMTLTGGNPEQAKQALTKSTEAGCATGLTAALAPHLPNGVFLEHCQITNDDKAVAGWAQDPVKAELCWKVSEEAVGQKFEY